MINTIYTKIPRERITYVTRPEFVNGQEQGFHKALKKSIIKSGLKDPLFIFYQMITLIQLPVLVQLVSTRQVTIPKLQLEYVGRPTTLSLARVV